jgi:hypothetical protein
MKIQLNSIEAQVSHVTALGNSGAANEPLLRGPHG